MENSTALPVVSDCMQHEHDSLYIATMVVLSAISTLITMFVRRRALARASTRATPFSSPPRGRGEEEIV